VANTKTKISSFLNSHQSVISGTFWITFFALSSKIFGFIKQILIGMFFGTSKGYDAVVIASGPSDFVAGIIAGAFASIAIPLYLEEKAKNGDESAKRYARGLLGFTSIFLLIFGLLLLIFPDFWIKIFAPGFSGQTVELAREYLRMFSILPLLTGWSSLFGQFLRGERKFFQSALAGFVISPVVIVGL
jgi:putative peptidoglycan lipid II flippase